MTSTRLTQILPAFARAGFVSGVLILLSGGVWASPPNNERQSELRYLLSQDCGSCHGMTMKGGLGPALTPEALAGKPDEYLVTVIMNGRPGTAMPPWRPFLTADEAQWLVRSVLRDNANPEPGQ